MSCLLYTSNFNTYFCPPYDGQPYGAADKVGASATPTDEYASSFDIRVGGSYEAFDWDNLSKYGNKPFDNREPRFYASILYNDATWIGRKLELYAGGKDNYMDFSITGQDNVHKSTTGYIFRKFMDDSGKVNFTNILSGTYWTEMRLAEIYLIRSEAYARQNQFGPAYEDLRTIRDRVGLPVLAQKGNWQDYLQDLAKELSLIHISADHYARHEIFIGYPAAGGFADGLSGCPGPNSGARAGIAALYRTSRNLSGGVWNLSFSAAFLQRRQRKDGCRLGSPPCGDPHPLGFAFGRLAAGDCGTALRICRYRCV